MKPKPSQSGTEMNSADELMVFPSPSVPLKRHNSPPPSYMQWMDETADRTCAWFARPIESRPPRRQPVPERFVME